MTSSTDVCRTSASRPEKRITITTTTLRYRIQLLETLVVRLSHPNHLRPHRLHLVGQPVVECPQVPHGRRDGFWHLLDQLSGHNYNRLDKWAVDVLDEPNNGANWAAHNLNARQGQEAREHGVGNRQHGLKRARRPLDHVHYTDVEGMVNGHDRQADGQECNDSGYLHPVCVFGEEVVDVIERQRLLRVQMR
ncbi:hypothetical protein BCR44DRAFT_1449677 [Catenaria anguillulae PL171]|uniref:Uncharacterized protein n=1 Tax=Catenaria anguillulae PL171 TaxID=765915 RepID=A0A1Y2H4J2_9FUNG|nr:hypothetical protein BCR44DRAFT_1449677 [Catenaria anguillulae PL171]